MVKEKVSSRVEGKEGKSWMGNYLLAIHHDLEGNISIPSRSIAY